MFYSLLMQPRISYSRERGYARWRIMEIEGDRSRVDDNDACARARGGSAERYRYRRTFWGEGSFGVYYRARIQPTRCAGLNLFHSLLYSKKLAAIEREKTRYIMRRRIGLLLQGVLIRGRISSITTIPICGRIVEFRRRSLQQRLWPYSEKREK